MEEAVAAAQAQAVATQDEAAEVLASLESQTKLNEELQTTVEQAKVCNVAGYGVIGALTGMQASAKKSAEELAAAQSRVTELEQLAATAKVRLTAPSRALSSKS